MIIPCLYNSFKSLVQATFNIFSNNKETTIKAPASIIDDKNKNIKFTVINEDTKEVEESGIWKITEIEDGYYNFSIQKRTKQNPYDGVKNNYRIIVSV